MKTIHKILFATAVAASFTLINRAGDIVMPPRALDNQVQTVPGVNNDPDLARFAPLATPRLSEQLASIAPEPNANSGNDPDLLNPAAQPAGTPKQQQLSQEVAPQQY